MTTKLTFRFTREELEEKRILLAESGITLTGDRGMVSKFGVELVYQYTDPPGELEIEIVKPGIMGEKNTVATLVRWIGAVGHKVSRS